MQWAAAPGTTEKHTAVRHRAIDRRRPERKKAGSVEGAFAATKLKDGYVFEALLPMAGLAEAKLGTICGFQVYVTDRDGPSWHRFTWHPEHGAHGDTNRTCAIRLARAGKPSPPVSAVAEGRYEDLKTLKITVRASADLAGKTAVATTDGKAIGRAALERKGLGSTAVIEAPMPPRGHSYGPIHVTVDEKLVAVLHVPSADAERAKRLMGMRFTCDGFAFTGETFPKIRLQDGPELLRILGKSTVATGFYDADLNKVDKAEKPGRYGAVIRVTDEDGKVHTRYRTVYRFPKGFQWWNVELGGEIELPEQWGVDPALVAGRETDVRETTKWLMMTGNTQFNGLATLLAGLDDLKNAGRADEKPTVYNSPTTLDRDYWVRLKRKLNGNAERYTKPLGRPTGMKVKMAHPPLRMGTEAEAGFKPGTADKLDATLTAWSKDTDTPFIACVARNGVAILNKAYGTKPDGSANDVHHATYMASLTKFMHGTLMMEFVDRGLVDLDAPITDYLPELKGVKFKRPITVRDLFVHTAGMWDHWGDDEADLEELVAEYGPYFEVGKRFSYNGMDLALASKIMEQIAGKALPLLYKEHLVGPLGMNDTQVTNSSYDARSTAWDMALLGQLHLGRGTFLPWTFFSRATHEKMLPRSLEPQLGQPTDKTWGIGCIWYRKPLGRNTIGHGSASSSTLRVDLDNNVIVSMTRPKAGKNFQKYHPQFLQVVAEGIVDAKNLGEAEKQE